MLGLDIDITMMVIHFVQIFLQFSIMTALFKSKVRWWVTLISSAVIAVIHFDSFLLMMAVFLISTIGYYGLIAKMRRKQILLVIPMQLFLVSTISSTIYVTIQLVLPELNLVYANFVSTLILCIVLILVTKNKITAINLTRDKITLTLSLALILPALSFTASEHILIFYADIIPTSIALWSLMGVIFTKMAVVYIIFILNKFTSEVENAELQKKYTATLEKSLDDWEGIQHGYRNLISTLKGLCRMENTTRLVEYINALESELVYEKNIIEINRSLKDNMPYIYGIVLSGTAFAIKNEIQFSINVSARVFDLKTINEVQLSRAVGNLLNNALEHANLSAKKYVSMEISNHLKQKIKIVIYNSVDEKVDTSKIFKKGFSGKKGHTGFGLYEVQTLVTNLRDEGWYVDFSISCDDNKFVAELLV